VEAVNKHTTVFKPTVNDLANDVKIGTVDAAIVWDATVKQYAEMVAVPEAWRGILTAGTLARARALGGFGPILVFSWAMRMRTEVLPTTVWLELSGGEHRGGGRDDAGDGAMISVKDLWGGSEQRGGEGRRCCRSPCTRECRGDIHISILF